MFDLRLVVYAPNGPRLGVLPSPTNEEAGWPLNDVPSFRLSYAATAVGADLLAEPCEVAVEWSLDGEIWAEPYDSRFLLIKRRGDDIDQTGIGHYELPGYGWQLRKLILYPGAAPLIEGRRAFNAVTPGAVLQTFLAEGQARGTGTLPGISWDFTTTHDSAGQPWAHTLTISYHPGIDALTALINLAEQGVLDFRMNGRTLQVYNPDTALGLGRDLASGPAPVELRYGRDIIEAPDEGTFEDAASALLVVGDDGFTAGFTSPGAVAPWGRWEQYVGQGGVSDIGTATLLAEAALSKASRERVQRTREITPYQARFLPWTTYRPGDRVRAPGAGRMLESLRVRQITLSKRDGRISGNLILNDRFLERDIKLARRTAGIVGGSTSSGGSGTAPAPDIGGGRTAAASAGLIVDGQAYVDEYGFARGVITATWGAVITDVSGVAVDVDGYELFMRRNEVGAVWFLLATTEPDDTSVAFSPLVVGQDYAFKVRAVVEGVKGLFSAQVAETIPEDAEAPPVPTAPQLSTRLGVIHIRWDGHGVGPVVMPSDFHRVRIWMQDPLAPGWSEIGYLEAAGSIVVPGQPYGADREVRFTSIDRSGNESGPSSSATIATVPLVDTDIIGEVLDGAKIIDGTVVASDKVVANTITGALIQALAIDAGHVQANSITSAKIVAGAIQTAHIAANQVTAAKLEAVLTLSTRVVAGNPVGARVEINSAGLEAYNGSGEQTVSIASASGAVSIIGQLATGTLGRRIIVNPAGSADPEIRFYPGSGANYARVYADTDGAIIHVSGLNGDSTRRSQVIQRGDEWRAHIYNPATGQAGGGYIFAKPAELEIGYNDATPALNRFRFTSGSVQYNGKWSWSGANAGLIMLSALINTNTGYSWPWGTTLAGTPLIVAMSDYNGDNRTSVRSRTTTGFGFQVYAATTVQVTVMVWAWQM